MSKFKAGDRVRVVKKHEHIDDLYLIGSEGEIIEKNLLELCIVPIDGVKHAFGEYQLELVDEKQMKKSDLKYGYVVKYRKGQLAMYMPSKDGDVFVNPGGFMWVSRYHNDLKAVSGCKKYDIVKVYGHASGCPTLDVSTEYRELLWKRNEAEEIADEIEEVANGCTFSDLEKAGKRLFEIAQEVRSLQKES